MEKLFEASVMIDNKKYNFQITSSTEKMGYGTSFSKIEDEIKRYFYLGYNDNKNSKDKKSNFEVKFNTEHIVIYRHLKSIFKQAYNYGYQKFDQDNRVKHYIDDLNIDNPILESKIRLYIDQIYNQGFSDGKKGDPKNNNIKIEKELYFINDINKLLIKVYNDGYQKGKDFFDLKYKIKIPKIDNKKLEDRIKKEIYSANATGLKDFDDNKPKKDFFSISLDFIEDILLKKQIEQIINSAYQDGYNLNQKQNEETLNKKRKEQSDKNLEKQKIYNLIKKHGEPLQEKFTSKLYRYVIQSDELKIKEDYPFKIKGITDLNVLKEITKIINSSFYKGQQDAINGYGKQFLFFNVPYLIKDELIKNELIDLVNKAYSDGYQLIIDQISKGLSLKVNKDFEKKDLEDLLQKSNFHSFKKIKNLPDRYLNQKIYSVEVPNEY
jgi:hypothetical protein